ncbi:MAG: hypothetical protein K2Q15_03630 [Burkholderiales bacterium]|nr:hypothetical protein [Burkholderiales bacterium]
MKIDNGRVIPPAGLNQANHDLNARKECLISKVGGSSTWHNNSVDQNRQIERNLGRLASESPIAHETANALLIVLSNLFTRVEGNELKAMTLMLASYSPESPGYAVVGQLAAGGFARIISEVKHNHQRNADELEPLTLREKAVVFDMLIRSNYFRETMEKVYSSLVLKAKVADLLGIGYLETKQLAPAYRSTKENPLPDQLAIYNFENINQSDASNNVQLYEQVRIIAGKQQIINPAKAGSSLTKHQNDYREKPSHGKAWISSADLLEDKRLTKRELEFARTNPKNRIDRTTEQFGQQKPVKAQTGLPLEQIIVERGNGFAMWDIKNGTGFQKDTELNHKPIVAGPSGTTDRFMVAARLLGKGVTDTLGLGAQQLGETLLQASERAEREMKELVSWVAVGYLVDDNHHSMIEVDLGAANHGLPVHWGSNLYTEPFSGQINTKKNSISNKDVVEPLENSAIVETHYDRFHYDL